jgi:serine/threonine-protein kinase
MIPRGLDLPGYRVLRPLGAGGMGSVLLVEPEALPGVTRALKVVAVGDAERRARFLREAELLARVDHCPGVVRVHDAGEHGGLLWVCMEHVDGEDLGQALARRGPLPWEEAVRLARDVALGLAEVHARGVVHRDVKPGNVVVDRAGAPHLVDFGVAQATDLERLTLSGTAMGTPAYFSPEQTSGRPVDGKSDVYSLGVTLYEVLTGTVPFSDGVPLPALVRAIVSERPEPPGARRPDLPPVVDRTVLAALEKDPGRRPDARTFAAMLEGCLTGPRGATTGERLVGRPGRGRARRIVAVGVVVAVGALGGVAALVGRGSDPAPRPALTPVSPAPVTERPPTPIATAPAPPREVTGPLAELVLLLERGEALRALGWLHARRDAAGAERRALEAQAGAAEAVARARAIQAFADAAAPPELATTLSQVVARLRDLLPAAERPAASDLADAALASLRAEARAARARRAASPDALDARLAARIGALGGVAATGVRAGDRPAAEAAADDLLLAFADGLVSGEVYVRALEALVALDVDLEWGHLAKARVFPGDGVPSAADDYVRLRIEVALDPTPLKLVARRLLLELLTSERGQALGPITRARGLCVGLNEGVPATEALARAREAVALDPRSPFALLVLAQRLAVHGQDPLAAHGAEIGRLVDGGLASFEAHHARRPSTTAWDHAMVLRTGVQLYTRLGRDAEARALIDQVRAVPGAVPEWIDELEVLMRTETETRAPR